LGIGFAKMGEELCVISKGKICFLTIGEWRNMEDFNLSNLFQSLIRFTNTMDVE
jgi:hypothetical protein